MSEAKQGMEQVSEVTEWVESKKKSPVFWNQSELHYCQLHFTLNTTSFCVYQKP